MNLKEELTPLKATVRMHVPGEEFNRVIDFYRVAKSKGTGQVGNPVEVSYRIVVLSDRGVVANRATFTAAKEIYLEFIDGWLDAGARDGVEDLPDGQLVQSGR